MINLKTAIDVGIIDQAFPADDSAWLLEIDAHDNLQVSLVFRSQRYEFFSILDRGFGIVNGAGADDYDETIIATIEDGFAFCAAMFNYSCGFIRERNLFDQDGGWKQRAVTRDATVIV